ncbi:MAG TPA: glycosyltransferase [Nitrospiraceae bacterium]|nr:glycosyltransferase [Nitrospiraceae bacterium]
MNIVMLAEVTLEQVIGGAERVLRQQALGLAKLGHYVRLMARAPFESAAADLTIGTVTERRYPVTRTSEPAFVRSSVRNSLRVFDLISQTHPIDIAMIHQSLGGLGPIMFRYGMVSRWVYVCHSLAHEEYLTRAERAATTLERVRRRLSTRARRWIERTVIRRCHHVIVLSEFMKRQVMTTHGIAPQHITVVPGAADPVTFHPVDDRNMIRRELKLPEGRTLMLTVRNLVPRMGLEHLLEAMMILVEEQRNLLLLIGGEGQLRPRLEELIRSRGIQDSVQLLGFVPEEQLAKYYQASDLVVLPTLQLEGFGLVTVEALACGTSVVGTPVGAIPEVLSTIDPMLVTEGTDGASLAKTLRLVLNRFREVPHERTRLSKKGREVVERRYNWVAHTADLDRLFVSLLKARQMAPHQPVMNLSRSDRSPIANGNVEQPSKPLKVIHVITRLDNGGSAQNTMLTALGHDRAQFEPLVVAGHPGCWDAQGGQLATEENCRQLEKAAIRWMLFPSLTREVHPAKDAQALWQLIRLFRHERPALVHTHTSKAGVLGRVAAWIARVPVIVHTPHGHVFYGHFGPFRSWLFLQIERMLSAITHRLIALTDAERQDHLDRAVGKADRFAVVPSGIDRERFGRARAQGKQLPDWFGCPPDALVVGSVGWLTDIKGHEYLIAAVAKLKQDFPALHLVIVGSGGRHDALLQQAELAGLRDAVHLLGHRDDIEACLAGMDLFVLPSLNEGMSRALIEAMIAGLPVIASRVGGIPAVISHERTGLLVPPGDVGALTEALRRFLDRPEWASQLGLVASRSVDSRYGSVSMVRAIESIFAEALSVRL